MTNKIEAQAAERDIPPPPSGGSWIFDRLKWEWVSKESTDQPAVSVKE